LGSITLILTIQPFPQNLIARSHGIVIRIL